VREEGEARVVWGGEYCEADEIMKYHYYKVRRDVPSLILVEGCPSINVFVLVETRYCRRVEIYDGIAITTLPS